MTMCAKTIPETGSLALLGVSQMSGYLVWLLRFKKMLKTRPVKVNPLGRP